MTRGPIISFLLFACAALLIACDREPVAKPTTAPAATQAATAPATKPFVARSYIDLIRKNFPKIATTQPLGVPVDLDDAAHFVLAAPIYLCPRGDLWITSAAARPAS